MSAAKYLALLALLTAAGTHAAEDNQELAAPTVFASLQQDMVAPAGQVRGDKAYAEQLVGLFVDNRNIATIQAIQSGDTWFLPIDEVAEVFNISHRIVASDLIVTTPQGEFGMAPDFVLRIGDRLYLSSDGLTQTLLFDIRFDSSAFALRVDLPWTAEIRSNNRTNISIEPDIVPAVFSLSQLRTDIYYTDNYSSGGEDAGTLRTATQLRGNLGEGSWHTEYVTSESGDSRFNEYYWVRAESNSQWLAGRDVVSPNPLVPGTEMTGLQWAWSNREIGPNTSRQADINSFYQAASNAPRRIQGTAEPGAVAELWIEGTRKAVTRVRLDGTFEFLGLELAGQQYNEIEVLIYNRQRTALLERQDFSTIGTNKLLNQGQTLVFAGGGVKGNWLSDGRNQESQDMTGALLLRRGVAPGLTLEASYTDTATERYQAFGFSSLLARRVALDGSAAFNNGAGAWSLEGGSQGENWRAFVSTRLFEQGFRSPDSVRELHQYLDAQYRVGRQMQLYLRGRNNDNGLGDAQSFLGLGVGWFARGWSIRATPSYNGDYRIESRLNRDRITATFLHDDTQTQVTVTRRTQPDLTWFGNIRQGDVLPLRAEYGVDWFPNSTADRNSRMQASIIGTAGHGAGFSLMWQSSLAPGVYTDVQLIRDPGAGVYSGEDDTRLLLRFTMDFALNGRRFVPAESYSARLNSGSLSGQLIVRNADGFDLKDVDVVAVKIDNIRHQVPLRGNYFYLDNIPEGVHRIELDAGLLPIELSPVGKSLWVKIAPGAVTSMDFELEFQAGFAGRVRDSQGDPLPYAVVTVIGEADGKSRQTRTDMFGLYRIDGLVPGAYSVIVPDEAGEPLGERRVELERAYLFEQDIDTR